MLFRRKRNTDHVQPNQVHLVKEEKHGEKVIHLGKKKPHKVWKYFIWGFVLLILGTIAWIGITGTIAWKNITAKNSGEEPLYFKYDSQAPVDLLKNEGDGRINILLIGIGGGDHAGANLADTIQIFSIDPINKTANMLSIPRDLCVISPCNVSNDKINAAYSNGIDNCSSTNNCSNGSDPGAELLKKTITDKLGIPIHYFARLDFQGFEQIIDTLGGIDVYVDQDLYDPLFPTDTGNGYVVFSIKAGQHHMDGRTALRYARSRETTSDFDRSKRQQKIVAATRDKLLSAGIIGNPKKVTDLITTAGNHFRTDLQASEMIRLATLLKDNQMDSNNNGVLDTSESGPLKSYNYGTYTIIPKLGMNDFSDVKNYIHTILKEPYLIKENAKIKIINATGKNGMATTISEQLKKYGYNVVGVEFASQTQYITDITYYSDQPYTLKFLKQRMNCESDKGKSKDQSPEADIILTLGTNYRIQ